MTDRTYIAGHAFTETPEGRRCYCGVFWRDIAGATVDDIGRLHIAHSGALNEAEQAQIATERERLWDLAMGGVG